jgi:exostosin family protein
VQPLGKLESQFWLGRFKVFRRDNLTLLFRDFLLPTSKRRDISLFDHLSEEERKVAYFQKGFVPACRSLAFNEVRDRPSSGDDLMFWQFPCRTEAVAWRNCLTVAEPFLLAGRLNLYIGLPWATWIDALRKRSLESSLRSAVEHQVGLLSVYYSGLRHVLSELGIELRLHTVCQHIYWQDMVPLWKRLGVTDLWLSHCPRQHEGFELHPWGLFAVNVEDPERAVGIRRGVDPSERKVLASFVGAYLPHYLNDVRLRLRQFVDQSDFVIRVTDKWHFEDVVYGHQISGVALDDAYKIDNSVLEYNRLLSDSVFALCPSGAGSNTLRLWEALAIGAVPVLLGEFPQLPQGGSLLSIDWKEIVLFVRDEDLPSLPTRLRSMPLEEIRSRSAKGMAAYQAVRMQRCF